jgi:hypothetical protein
MYERTGIRTSQPTTCALIAIRSKETFSFASELPRAFQNDTLGSEELTEAVGLQDLSAPTVRTRERQE